MTADVEILNRKLLLSLKSRFKICFYVLETIVPGQLVGREITILHFALKLTRNECIMLSIAANQWV